MSLPDALRAVLPPETARAWSELAPLLPSGAYLAGGTGLAAHIHHRVSRDLDLFFHEEIDLDALREQLAATGRFAPTRIGDGVLDGVLAEPRSSSCTHATSDGLHPPVASRGSRSRPSMTSSR